MKVVIISRSGATRAVQLHRRHFFGIVPLIALALVVTGWSLPTGSGGLGGLTTSETVAIDRWRAGILEDTQHLDELRRQFVAESEAQGKLLARMEARLLRMEAFGARMVETAALDPTEFDFADAPAVGGASNSGQWSIQPRSRERN